MKRLRFPEYRYILSSLGRFLLILAISLSVATLLNRDTYKDFYGKKLFRLHTLDLKTIAEQMTIKLNFFLSQGNKEGLQDVLDASFGLFGFVVTDCKSTEMTCPEQRILFASDKNLPWLHFPRVSSLPKGSFTVLRWLQQVDDVGGIIPSEHRPGEIIGRLYVIRNMPESFNDDYVHWIRSPLSDIGARPFYLRTSLAFLAGALIIWGVAELYFMIRRRQKRLLQHREFELKQSVNRQMKQLAENDAHITRLNEQTARQYEAYVEKIRSLNRKMKSEEEFHELAEQIIVELEHDKSLESAKHAEDLANVRREMERLESKVREFEGSTKQTRESSYKELEDAVRAPLFSNLFEQQIFEVISSTDGYKTGLWRLVSNFDVAPGRNYRQFTDFILFNKDAVIIIEAKYYPGLIDSPGDFLNDIWISASTQRKKIECLWGENPYHQINEYSKSLMKILKQRSPWNFQIFGVILFPDEADISKVGEHLGKFYRVTKVSRLPALAENIFAEANRFQAAKNPRRPKAEQVEDMLRGRKVSS
jgi:Nuclease-related domain